MNTADLARLMAATWISPPPASKHASAPVPDKATEAAACTPAADATTSAQATGPLPRVVAKQPGYSHARPSPAPPHVAYKEEPDACKEFEQTARQLRKLQLLINLEAHIAPAKRDEEYKSYLMQLDECFIRQFCHSGVLQTASTRFSSSLEKLLAAHGVHAEALLGYVAQNPGVKVGAKTFPAITNMRSELAQLRVSVEEHDSWLPAAHQLLGRVVEHCLQPSVFSQVAEFYQALAEKAQRSMISLPEGKSKRIITEVAKMWNLFAQDLTQRAQLSMPLQNPLQQQRNHEPEPACASSASSSRK